ISDDNSTDHTIAIIESLNDTRIKIIMNDRTNSGHVRNFENALKHSKGDIIFLSDQDDVWHPAKAKKMVSALEKNDVVVCNCFVVDQNLNEIGASFFTLKNSGKGFFKNLYKNSFLGCCMAFKRPILEKALPFPKDIISHDTWIGLIGECYGETIFISDQLHYFRRHGDNFSVSNDEDSMSGDYSPYSFFEKIKMRLILLKNIVFRLLRR